MNSPLLLRWVGAVSFLLPMGPSPAQEPAASRDLPPPRPEVRIVATIPDLVDLVQTIGGPAVQVEGLIRAGHDPHMVLPKASLLLKLQRADGLVLMGLDYEHAFLPPLLEKCRNPAVQPGGIGFADLSRSIQALEVPQRLDRAAGADLHPRGNPHYNTDPEGGRKMAAGIRDLLQRLDPGRHQEYHQRWQVWDRSAQEHIKAWKAYLEPLRGRPLVTYHRSWPYFARRFGMVLIGEVEPKPGLRPSPRHLTRLASLIQEKQAKVLLMEPWYPSSDVDKLVQRTGLKRIVVATTSGATTKTLHYLDWIGSLVESIGVAYGLGPVPPLGSPADKEKVRDQARR